MDNEKHGNLATDISGLFQRSYSTILANSGKIVAIITALVAALVTFTDITFGNITSESFSSSLIVMLLSSYLIYFSLLNTGEQFGESSPEYKAAYERYCSVSEKVTPEDILTLRDYCTEYAKEESLYRRRMYLYQNGCSEIEFEKWQSEGKKNSPKRRIYRKAERILPRPLTPMMLLSKDGSKNQGELENPGRSKFIMTLLGLIPSTLGTVFTVSVMLTAKDGLTSSAVIEGILKLSALPIIGFKGYTAGYEYIKNSKSAWLISKARILEGFIQKSKK